MTGEQQLLIWSTDIVREGNGSVRLVPSLPLSHMSARQAAKVLGCSSWTIGKLFRLGLLKGFKPGAARNRKDKRASNASLRLDTESVLKYKQRQEKAAVSQQEDGHW